MAQKQANRGVILAAAAVCNGLVGALYMWSIFSLPLEGLHGWSPEDIAFAYSLYLILECSAGLVCGRLQMMNIEPKILATIGGLLLSSGWFFSGFAESISTFYVLFSLLGGTGSGFLYNVAVATATKWFPDKRGFANGVCLGATGLSPLLFAPLGNFLIETTGVTMSFHICGLICLVCTLGSTWILKAPPTQPIRKSNSSVERIPASNDCTPRQMLHKPAFWALWVLYAVAASAGMMLIGHASSIGQHLVHLTASQGALQVGILAVANFSGRLVFSSLSDKVGRYPVLIFVLFATAINFLFCFGAVNSFLSFTIALAAAGMCFGGVMAIMPPLCGDLFGVVNFSQNYAILFSGYTCASLIGPMVGATTFSKTGSYSLAFTIAGVLALAGIGFVLITRTLGRRI